MKIHSLRFENLNSLQGQWQIDFNHPAYRNSPIFAITGPTGSGKTTLLDAICLALYGRTPRLKTLSKSTNELLTRQTGRCFSEIEFETVRGRFRCHWSQHRARRRPDGELQQPRHEIADAASGAILASNMKEVAGLVEEATGMTFTQFTRSILLAQGNFAAFLQAPADERSPLLEQITGTEIYSTISQRVHGATAEQERLYAKMHEELNATALLSKEEEQDLAGRLAEMSGHSEALATALASLRADLGWLEGVTRLEDEVRRNESELAELKDRLERDGDLRRTLVGARRAASLLGLHQRLLVLASKEMEEEAELRLLLREKDELAGSADFLHRQYREEASRLTALEDRAAAEALLGKIVRGLDFRQQELAGRHRKEEATARELDRRIGNCRHRLEELARTLRKAGDKRRQCLEYFAENSCDAKLEGSLGLIKERAEGLARSMAREQALQQRLQTVGEDRQRTAARLADAVAKSEEAARQTAERQKAHRQVEDAISRLETSFPNLRVLLEEATERVRLGERLEQAIRDHEAARSKAAQLEEERRKTAARRREKEAEIASLKEAVASQKTIVEQQQELVVLRARLDSFEEERGRLKNGEPCPLCGATTHPYADSLPDVEAEEEAVLAQARQRLDRLEHRLDAAREQAALLRGRAGEHDRQAGKIADETSRTGALREMAAKAVALTDGDDLAAAAATERQQAKARLAELREQANQLGRLEQEEKALRLSLTELQRQERAGAETSADLRFQAASLQETEKELKAQAAEAAAETGRQKGLLRQDLTPFGYAGDLERGVEEISTRLQARLEQWRLQKETENQLAREIGEAEKQHQTEQALLAELENESRKQKAEVDLLAGDLVRIGADRRRLYGDKNPDSEERRLQDETRELRLQLQLLEEKRRQAASAVALNGHRRERLRQSLSARKEEREELAERWRQDLETQGFSDDHAFAGALLPPDRVQALEDHFAAMQDRILRLQSVLEERSQALEQERQKKRTEATAEELGQRLAATTEEQQHLLREIGRVQGRLDDNRRQTEELRHRRRQLERQRKELERWRRLDELIGSANGKKFRNFAQGITFEIMVRQANGALRLMTDRYLLVRASDHPLELDIIDNYRGGDIRSTKNLSGGESFLVSLALALGLSRMASSTIRVDALFLDEGFGSLDEETLETALQTLTALQREGRMIGIISHVSLLKERLETQIQVIPGRGGHSSLAGPGVRAVQQEDGD